MADRWDVVSFRKTKAGKTFALRLGSALQRDDGGFALYLDCLPGCIDGQFQMNVVKPRPRAASEEPEPF